MLLTTVLQKWYFSWYSTTEKSTVDNVRGIFQIKSFFSRVPDFLLKKKKEKETEPRNNEQAGKGK